MATLLSCFSILLALGLCFAAHPELKIPLGRLQGDYLESRDGRTYSAFRGIPYAEPPKRYKAAEPVKPWKNVKDATKLGNVCMQPEISPENVTIIGSEDCLYLNVYTPDVNGAFPVIVHIPGGGFTWGSSNIYGATYFMDEDVVLVTLNYRLGALGFLSTGDHVIPGNFGLKDQNMALRWVQENIKYFGGNKEKVTIVGDSAGSASVWHHVISPKSKGLFHSAIAQSGSVLNPWAFVEDQTLTRTELAETLGCDTGNSQKLAECLEGKSGMEILRAQVALNKWHIDPPVPFSPTKEPDSDEAFLTETPYEILKKGKQNKVPLIATAAAHEGQLFHSAAILHYDHLKKELNEEWLKLAPLTFMYRQYNLPQDKLDALSTQLKEFYLEGKKVDKKTQQALSDLYSDRWFLYGIQKAALLQAKHSPVYTGIFDFKGGPSMMKLFGVPGYEDVATHVDEIKYLYTPGYVGGNLDKGSSQVKISKMLVKLWVKFATTSSLEGSELSLNGVAWPKVSSDEIEEGSINWFHLNENEPKILKHKLDKRMKFWDNILKEYKQMNYDSSSKDEL